MSPRVRRFATTLGALVASGVLALSAFAGAAGADTTYFYGVPNSITSITLTKSSAEMKQIAAYWNPNRIKEAQDNTPASFGKPTNGSTSSAPASPTPTSTATSTATGAATTAAAGGEATTATVVPALAYGSAATSSTTVLPTLPRKAPPAAGNSPITVGKVFFSIGGKDYWCSASAVASKSRSLVATAGHCAYDAKLGRHADHWIFIPGYDRGNTPYGIYVGHSLNLHEDFVGRGDYDYDYAFVNVHDGFKWKPGKTAGSYEMESMGSLEDNVGGQGLVVNRGINQSTLAFGYPAAPQIDGSRPYDGQKLRSCVGRTKRRTAPTYLVQLGIALNCQFTGGASGGPWLVNYNPGNGLGYLNGVNSFAWDTDVDRKYDLISSPYFIASTYNVYRWADSQQAK
ncbi:trypsin-like serine peptidase [Streptosporangium sp. NBC_01756]|uniref:trypsin-like serine peptidase n=1 Tax=Streptosporangium sp. NBC_01756 TaxID=2975950 RepID=UPI002DDA59C2|nr:trypsin-like serine protease [Streptosporangium sp. NBC_01756]WSC89084.1 trypsin-like serine protease [Streptosporangium sp. NBC_01756]